MELKPHIPPAMDSPHTPRMPMFAEGTHAHTHSIHSALTSLAALGIASPRIIIRRTGRELVTPGTVIRQHPSAGMPIFPDTFIQLDVAGLGFTHALPVGMWDSGGEAHAGTREILEHFDDPLEKLRHWFHEGAPLFRIAPDDLAACLRWLRLFGVDASEWPRRLWYRLAALIASVPQLSCSQDGCAFVLDALLELPTQSFSYHPSLSVLPQSALSSLGVRASRLGVDLVMGDTIEDFATLQIEFGPVTLEVYEYYAETDEGSFLLHKTLEMIVPASTSYDVQWCVLDRNRAPRLGLREHNARLGINTHMGGMLEAERSNFHAESNSHKNLNVGATYE